MRSVPDNDALTQVERLVGELRAIERWNTDHWRKRDPKRYEVFAFVARRKRRAEILSELLTLIPRLDIKAQGAYGSPSNRAQRKHRKPASPEA